MAEEAVPAAPSAGATAFRSIGELAELCGHYCWLERRLFEVTGSRASGPATDAAAVGGAAVGDPAAAGVAEIRVLLSQMSARHGFFAAQWQDRLPVRAGVDAEALVTSPPGSAAEVLDLLESAPRLAEVLDGLALHFLPHLLDSYERDRAQASPVSEAPVRAVLEWAAVSLGAEIRDARLVLERRERAASGEVSGGDLGARVQRLLGGPDHTFPGARAS
jgi:hypothetical protein